MIGALVIYEQGQGVLKTGMLPYIALHLRV